MALVQLRNITKSFTTIKAVRDLTLDIADGEFFSLLGPSGCGKTTLLRIIAGFENPDSGNVLVDKNDITHKHPNQRNAGMVFQSYALFPHLSVFENVAFGLRARKRAIDKIKSEVGEALKLVNMQGYENRPVTQLSGGQQQRIALARAIAIKPSILLLDEPLSNLDAQLRKTTRAELKILQSRLGITTIYVTHDQEEALALSDRIAVIKDGKLQQVGTPVEIYHSPEKISVMKFIGDCNVLDGKITARNEDGLTVSGSGWQIVIRREVDSYFQLGESVQIAFRPENFELADLSVNPEKSRITGKWHSSEYVGMSWLLHVMIGNVRCTARIPEHVVRSKCGNNNPSWKKNECVQFEIVRDNIKPFSFRT